MPNFERDKRSSEDDLDIASRVMDTVQKQVESYHKSLEILRGLRKELTDDDSGGGGRVISTPQQLAELFEERGIPTALSKAMAAEDFQDENFEAAFGAWTWDCCCTDCCITCQMATAVTGCPQTFVFVKPE